VPLGRIELPSQDPQSRILSIKLQGLLRIIAKFCLERKAFHPVY
jgi:hypothetical protein